MRAENTYFGIAVSMGYIPRQMKRNGRYRLERRLPEYALFGLVALEVLPEKTDADPPVRVCFSDGVTNPADEALDWKAAITFGIKYGAQRLDKSLSGTNLTVIVTDVGGHIVDTTYKTLAYVACLAFWKALGHVDGHPPTWNWKTKEAHFP